MTFGPSATLPWMTRAIARSISVDTVLREPELDRSHRRRKKWVASPLPLLRNYDVQVKQKPGTDCSAMKGHPKVRHQ